MLWLRGPWDVSGKSKGGLGGGAAGKGNNQGQHGAGLPGFLPEESAYLTIFLTSNLSLPANTWTRLTASGILRQSGVANPSGGQITVPSGKTKMRLFAVPRTNNVSTGGMNSAINNDTLGFSWQLDDRLPINESGTSFLTGWLPCTAGDLLSMYQHPGNGGKTAPGQATYTTAAVWPNAVIWGVEFRA